jgi:hypothetical protein
MMRQREQPRSAATAENQRQHVVHAIRLYSRHF